MENYLVYSKSTIADLSELHKELKFEFLIKNIGINISVFFVYGLRSQLEENNNWREISDGIALKYQSRINDVSDKWNLYIIYVFIDSATKEFKSQIESDKFSSRKIVEDEFEGEFTTAKAEDLIVKHITNTDLENIVRNTKVDLNLKYEPSNQNIWSLMHQEELISGNTDLQKKILQQLKNIQNEDKKS